MGELVKKADVNIELTVASASAPAPAKLFKHSNYALFVLSQPNPRALTPVINREAWVAESMGGGLLASIVMSLMGAFFVVVPIAAPFWGGAPFNPAELIVIIPTAAFMPIGLYSARRHVGRLRWVKQTSVRRIRAWLSAAYGLHVLEIEPKLAERFLNRNSVGATMALVDEVGRAFTLYRVADNRYVLRDAQREVVAQLPAAEPVAIAATAADSALRRLPRPIRAAYGEAGALHATLAARAGLSPEHEHRVSRAGDVLAEIASLTADLTKRPTAAYVKNIEAALGAIMRDMEEIKDEIDAALSRQAEVLAVFTREVTGK